MIDNCDSSADQGVQTLITFMFLILSSGSQPKGPLFPVG